MQASSIEAGSDEVQLLEHTTSGTHLAKRSVHLRERADATAVNPRGLAERRELRDDALPAEGEAREAADLVAGERLVSAEEVVELLEEVGALLKDLLRIVDGRVHGLAPGRGEEE
jgi:hypothetical protein